jgi:hypothetical protein
VTLLTLYDTLKLSETGGVGTKDAPQPPGGSAMASIGRSRAGRGRAFNLSDRWGLCKGAHHE